MFIGRSAADFSGDAFPFGTVREIEIGYGLALAFRMTSVGELGWELHIPTKQTLGTYDALAAAGSDFNLRHAGSLRPSAIPHSETTVRELAEPCPVFCDAQRHGAFRTVSFREIGHVHVAAGSNVEPEHARLQHLRAVRDMRPVMMAPAAPSQRAPTARSVVVPTWNQHPAQASYGGKRAEIACFAWSVPIPSVV